MTRRVLRFACALLAASFTAGCSAIAKDAGFSSVQELAAERTGQEPEWQRESDAQEQTTERVRALLAHDLTVDSAVKIALLNNLSLQATYEELGIARADLVQAGLLKNPVLSVERRFSGKALEIDVLQEFMDALFIPLRKRVAGAAFEAAKLRVTQVVIELATDVRAAFYNLQASGQLVEMRRAVLHSAEASAEFATRLHAAGNITDLDWRMEQRLARDVRLDLAESEQEVIEQREHLNTLMGLWSIDTTWNVAARLPDLPDTDIERAGLEALAVSQRLDLAAAQQDIVTAAQSLGLTKALRFTSGAEVTAHYERESEGSYSIGPAVQIALPIFDWGQAAVPRDRAVLKQKQQRYIALAVEIRSQVRALHSRMQLARERTEFYRQTVLPLQVEIRKQAQLQYNAMQIGAIELFEQKQNEIESGREYIEALRDYWIARAELERALGGRIQLATARPEHEAVPAPAIDVDSGHQHHQHHDMEEHR